MDSFSTSFSQSMDSIKEKAQKKVQSQEQLAKMKADLRDAEDEFVKILSVKTHKEAKQMATRDSISAAKARIDELKRTVEVHRARRDEYMAIISKQSLGVKFTFRNVSMKNPNDEYTLSVHHVDDTYNLLDCDPPLNNIKESIQEFNRMNGLFKFVRFMRERFEEAAALGLPSRLATPCQDSSTISVSAPGFSVSTDK